MPARDEIAVHLSLLRSEHVEEAESAALWLLERREQAEPRLRALAAAGSTGNPRLALPLLARMGSPESVAVLERVVSEGPDGPAWYAAQALAIHPRAEAREALARLLRAPAKRSRMAAADALGDPSAAWACSILVAALGDPEPDVREHAVRAIGRAGCAARAAVHALADHDAVKTVRDAAKEAERTLHN